MVVNSATAPANRARSSGGRGAAAASGRPTPYLLGRVTAALKAAWLLVGITVVVLVMAELLASVWLHLRDGEADGVDYRVRADGYGTADWARDYFREFNAANRVAWEPYVYWRRQPFGGRFINIDATGLRKTWNAGGPPAGTGTRRRVFFFGGSTMWGTGARDDYTVASLVSRLLSTHTPPASVEVTNFGEGGYVSTQEVITLLRELQRGNVPDVAIFLDGVNDVFAAFQAGSPGVPQNESNRIREFNIDLDGRIYKEAARTLLQRSALYALAGGAAAHDARVAPQWDDHLERLGDGTVQVYASTIDIVRRLAQAYHFEALFYWQPVIFTKPSLTPYEQQEAQRQAGLKEFYVSVYGKVRERLAPAGTVRDLAQLFAADDAPRFIDFCHLTEAGNEQIAGAMLNDVLRALRRRS